MVVADSVILHTTCLLYAREGINSFFSTLFTLKVKASDRSKEFKVFDSFTEISSKILMSIVN